jgi:hypothetical protein
MNYEFFDSKPPESDEDESESTDSDVECESEFTGNQPQTKFIKSESSNNNLIDVHQAIKAVGIHAEDVILIAVSAGDYGMELMQPQISKTADLLSELCEVISEVVATKESKVVHETAGSRIDKER